MFEYVLSSQTHLPSVNIRQPNEAENRPRLVGSLHIVRLLWPLIIERVNEFTVDQLRNVSLLVQFLTLWQIIVGVICCVDSSHAEVVVASLEALEAIFTSPLADMLFFPPFVANQFSPEHKTLNRVLTERSSLVGSPAPGKPFSNQ